MAEADAGDVVRQICEGLKIMHDDGFTHRDLKPANIFVLQCQPRWRVKIGDFGVSKHTNDDTELRTTVGSRLYSAPEVLHMLDDDDDDDYDDGQSSSYTNAVDMWSLGVIAFEMLCGQRPFLVDRDIRAYCSGKLKSLPAKMTARGLDLEAIEMTNALLIVEPGKRPDSGRACLEWMHLAERLRATLSHKNSHIHTPRVQDSLQDLGSSFKALSTQDEDKASLVRKTSHEPTIRRNPLQRSPPVATSFHQETPPVSSREVNETRDRDTVQRRAFSSQLEPRHREANHDESVHKNVIREWTDRSGAIELTGSYTGIDEDGTFVFQEHQGLKRKIRLSDVSAKDLDYIEHTTGMIFDESHKKSLPQEPARGKAKLLEPPMKWQPRTLFRHNSYDVTFVTLSEDAKMLASASSDNRIRIWDATRTGAPLQTLDGPLSKVTMVTFSRDGKLLASASESGPNEKHSENHLHNLWIWHVTKRIFTFRHSTASLPVKSMAFSADGFLMFPGWTSDNMIKIWRAATCRPVRAFSSHLFEASTIALSGDGKLLASGSSNGVVKIWSIASGTLLQNFKAYSDMVFTLALSWNGRLLISASAHSTIQIGDPATGVLIDQIGSPIGRAHSVALSGDGKVLACGYMNGSIAIWDDIS